MNHTIFKGSAVALVTPMKENKNIDYNMLETLIEYQIEHHTDAIVVAGTTGEASTMSEQEHREIIRTTVDFVNHRIPVIAGAGSNDTLQAVELARMAEKEGADALLEVTPYYNKCSQLGLVKHFTTIAEATSLPIMLYNIPSRTGVNIQPQTYEQICKNDRVVAVKEASGNFSQIAKISALYGNRLDIYSGNDDQITSTLALGAKGVVSVLANILPEETHRICESFFQRQADVSDELQLKYFDLIEALFYDVNPIPIKYAMNAMGIPVGPCRLPLCEMEPIEAEKLLKALKKHGMLSENAKEIYQGKASILQEGRCCS